MTSFNKNSIDSIAKKIVSTLDQLDDDKKGSGKGIISADTWNNIFQAKEKGGKEILQKISVFNAEKSIKYYLKQCMGKNTESVNDIGQRWLDAVLEKEEINSCKNTKIETSNIDIKPEVAVSTYVDKSVPEDVINFEFKNYKIAQSQKQMAKTIANIKHYIHQEIEKRGIGESKVDVEYWTNIINNVVSQYNVSPEIITSIISRECTFVKNISKSCGRGAMALTGIAIRSFFPGSKGNWHETFKKLDKKLLDDILYVKDSNGDFVTNSDGTPKLKYKNYNELLMACGKDDELSIKVGSLFFEMKYAEAVAEKTYGRVTWENVDRVIDKIKSGELIISEQKNEECIALAVTNYNGNDNTMIKNNKRVVIKKDYGTDVMDSLRSHGYNFAEQNIIKS